MRVISGKQKGKILNAVPGMGTRPTTDKVKEAIFNMIGPYFSKGIGLDLFAGSGGLGIEALSRGMEKIIFIDRDFQAVQTIKTNLQKCGLESKSEVFRNNAERALKAVVKRNMVFDVVFLDPPYKKQKLVEILSFLAEQHLLSENGYVVCEHAVEIELPEEVSSLTIYKQAKYGITGITIYIHRGDNGDGKDSDLSGEF
ncbi:16S rRNA (guanine(966)-N(2))-methyltransferase RsmD [Heyndrickxia ginsengihumi]|uniref:16S rRNA (Guanine(966)-N(2))-methyltransferase RsmD n=1 Tax=Heyndrickxia ginsengihumi TaxID=363870 RepID=A0A6M0P1Z7_9BACI|nr:16S rRNA (guanine(966)-N(2))-methyltransferase RsmD [Heyndrickxia ginsengihumi]MBE6183676.1 16S rRNA (guanine(966)-N(2))-methyltransferase RsmD [Bacillus sp. (in: firmicutes)]MCM3022386.1 16S rRNA (guanine(966)-N(2))-methyltransferase RsmD [Heyndrickxia ginsengihumi]NEY18672.1 16S rRNA (guanine(966)-N(2))-methyltransferase RsmD [Heyndrickxia ginsengihumi]